METVGNCLHAEEKDLSCPVAKNTAALNFFLWIRE